MPALLVFPKYSSRYEAAARSNGVAELRPPFIPFSFLLQAGHFHIGAAPALKNVGATSLAAASLACASKRMAGRLHGQAGGDSVPDRRAKQGQGPRSKADISPRRKAHTKPEDLTDRRISLEIQGKEA